MQVSVNQKRIYFFRYIEKCARNARGEIAVTREAYELHCITSILGHSEQW